MTLFMGSPFCEPGKYRAVTFVGDLVRGRGPRRQASDGPRRVAGMFTYQGGRRGWNPVTPGAGRGNSGPGVDARRGGGRDSKGAARTYPEGLRGALPITFSDHESGQPCASTSP